MGVYKPFKTLPEMFDVITKEFKDRERPLFLRKVKGKYEGVSYTTYRMYVKRFMLGLHSIGLEKGDKVGIVSENRIEWFISDIALLSLGVIDVPVFPSLPPAQLEYIMNDAGVKFIIVSSQFQLNKINKIKDNIPSLKKIVIMNEKYDIQDNVIKFSDVLRAGEHIEKDNSDFFERSIYSITPDDIATIIYTSGTTGNPKGVVLTHNNFVFQIKSATQYVDIKHTDIFLSFLPLSHIFERTATAYVSFSCGSQIAFADSIDTVGENLVEVKPTWVTTVPRLFERIHGKIMKTIDNSSPPKQKIFYWAIEVGKQYALAKKSGLVSLSLRSKYSIAEKLVFSKLREKTGGKLIAFISGGASLPRELGTFFEAIGITIVEGYGLTETAPIICVNRLEDYKFGSVGRPIPGVQVKIANDGEILTKGPLVMKGYHNLEKETKEAIDSDGWFHTGDIGHLDSEGYLFITDRKKHLFVSSGGKNIAPQQIENLFLTSKYINQFVLIGDRRQFLSALIAPDIEAIKEYAYSHQISYENEQDLVNNEQIYKLIEKDMSNIQQDLANYERVKKFVLLDKPLTLESGEVTPTLKVKREVIEKNYSNLIEEMYKSPTNKG
jgi:long-chain acyl-CoA synthetase